MSRYLDQVNHMITEKYLMDLLSDLDQIYNVVGEIMSTDNVEYAEMLLIRNRKDIKAKLNLLLANRV